MTQAYSIEVYQSPPVKLFFSSWVDRVLETLEYLGYGFIATPANEDDRTDEEREAATRFLLDIHYEAE